jgi:tetratricopeptide (TPR) repeat protein
MKHKKKSNTRQKPAPGIIIKEKSAGKEWIIILIIFFAAFFIRCLYLYQAHNYSALSTSISDPASFDEAARVLVKEGKITNEFFWHAPFYPFFLSLLYLISGSSILFAKIIQIALGSLTVVFVYLSAKKYLKKETALIGAGLAAICFPLIFFEGELFSEGIAGLFCILLVYGFTGHKDRPKPILCFLTGLLGSAAIATRSVFLPFFIAASAWCLWSWIKTKAGYKKILLFFSMIFVGLMTLLLPLCFINLAVDGEFTFLPYSGGINSFIGNNPDYDYTITIRPGYAWDQLIGLPESQGIKGVYPKDNYFNNRTWDFILSRPLDYIKGLAVKTVEFASSREIPRTEDIYMFRDRAPLLFAGVWKAGGFGFPFGILFPLALIGIIGFRKRIPGPALLMLVLYPLSVIVIFVSSRYRAPILPLICLLASGGITWLYEQVKEKKWKNLGISSAVILGSLFLIILPGPFIEEKMDLRAEYNIGEGMYYERINDATSAINDFKKAIELQPCFADAEFKLGSLYSDLKQYNEASEELNKVLRSSVSCFFNHTGIPENVTYIENHKSEFMRTYSIAIIDTHKLLGNIMLASNRLDDAFSHYSEAVALSPRSFDVLEVMGDIKTKQMNYKKALSLYTQALPYDPQNPTLYSKLGQIFAKTGALDDALTNFKKFVELEPGSPLGYFSLGNVYYEKNEINMAIENFKLASKMMPFEPAIYYRIGLCYMKQGDYKSAESAFMKSYELKPDPLVLDALKKLNGKL